jgi:hypothetical protein
MEHDELKQIDLQPRYSTRDIPGHCLKCLAEEKLFDCMRQLLRDEGDSEELVQRYEMLYSFLKSQESQQLRGESEKLLADGKEVSIRIFLEAGKPRYELIVK